MPYSLIIFDCDGTLVDTEHLNIKAIIELLNDFGVEGYDTSYGLSHFSGHRFSHIIDIISEQTGFTFPKNASKLYVEKINNIADDAFEKIENVHEMVETAKTHAKICVVSNGERSNVLSSLERVELRHFFEDKFIFTGLMAPNPKPAPDLFLLAAKEIDVCPTKTLVIEDSIAGIQAAKAASMDAWGFCGTHHAPIEHADKLLNTGAKATYKTMLDIKDELENLFLNKIERT